jgi:predicted DNA-binding transcriptional regulator YafY
MAFVQSPMRAGQTRRPIQRIYHIHEAVRENRFPNCTTLAAELEVTPKTIMRDITFMRDELGLPIEYVPDEHCFRYSADVGSFPVFEVGAEELAGLFLARRALDSVKGTQLEKTMAEVFAKLTKTMAGQVKFAWADLDRAFSRKPLGKARTDLKLFGRLAEAVLKRREVQFSYRKLGAGRSALRRLQPYHLGEIDNCWYVIGRDLDRRALRTFALPRMCALKVLRGGFEVPDDFDGAAYLGSSFGVWTDPERPDFRQVVRIELSGYAARLAQERRWHPSQQVKPLDDAATRVEVSFEVGRLEEVLRWTLSWGGRAKVRAPEELRRLVRAEVARMGGR